MYTNNINFGYSNNYINSLYNSSFSTRKNDALSSLNDLFLDNYGNNNASNSKNSANIYQLKQLGSQMVNSLNLLSNKGKSSMFESYNMSSSNEKTAVILSNNQKSKNPEPYNIQVDNIAKRQVNSDTDKYLSSSKIEVGSGNYSFSIEANNKTYNFDINVKASDSNKAIQEKMAAAVNSRKIGVNAAVSYDSKNKTSMLSVSSESTGIKSAFNVEDTKGTLASRMGITNTSQEAKDAVYSINDGPSKTSANNDIEVSDGLKVTLKGEGSTKITSELSASKIVDAAKNFVSTLNDALDYAKETPGKGADRLFDNIWGMNQSYKASLDRVGIIANKDGSLSVDEDKLKESAENGSLKRLFQDSSGFAKRVSSISNDLKSGSSYYANSNVMNYQTDNKYTYNPYASIGMLFDAGF